ncbi:TolC family protein [Gluconacetobacter sacchari]|uniref:Protein CyaE n=2 Tax=Gluconacetobacter sacchari TaxID=92759 RepID=A0A7W4IBJ8_9PROT|nr:TolC family protein [Gluconacetobacter sacchari]MBB2159861.1 TolC family protein [Gluconacetobacter sacchari]
MKTRFKTTAAMTLLLAGCATSELATAPPRPDQPWTPDITAEGAIVPPGQGRRGLTLPPGYSLPSDPTVVTRGASPALPARTGQPYTLADLIDIAQSANPQTRRAWNTARDAALAVGIAKSTYLPHLTATVVGGWSHSQARTSDASLDTGGYGTLPLGNGTGNRNSGAGEVQTLGLEWLLFDFGRREATIAAARQAQIATNVLFTAAHQRVIYAVTTAFHTHAAAAARARLLHTALDNARHVQAAAEARLRQGQGTILDVTQARQATAQVALRLVQAEGEDENTYLALLAATGVSAETRIALADMSGRPLTQDDARLSEEMVKRAVARRPDVLAAYAAARAAHSRVGAARDAFLPSIFLTGNVSYATGRMNLTSVPGAGSDSAPTLNLSANRFSSLVLGGISVPIFDGGLRAAVARQAQDQSDSAEATLRQTVNDSIQQIVASENALRTGLHAYAAATTLRDASRTSFDAALAAYRGGTGAITQAELAQNGLLEAEISRSDAYYATLIAAAGLAFSTGALGN